MTKLLDRALAKARQLPDDAQDALAIALRSMADAESPIVAMDEETRAAIR